MAGKRQFGSIRQLPSGRWQARYRDIDGELVAAPTTFPTKGDAGSWLAAAQTDRTRGTFVDHRAGEVRFEDWAQEWAATIVNLRESTTKRDLDYLKRYLLPAFGTLQLSAIDHIRVRRWVAQLSRAAWLRPPWSRRRRSWPRSCGWPWTPAAGGQPVRPGAVAEDRARHHALPRRRRGRRAGRRHR